YNAEQNYRPWLLLGWVTAEPILATSPRARPLVVVQKVIFKPLVPRLSVKEDFLVLTSPATGAELQGIKCPVAISRHPIMDDIQCLLGCNRKNFRQTYWIDDNRNTASTVIALSQGIALPGDCRLQDSGYVNRE
ncbi:hypothetical protein J6590_087699, partial [Homalodisca vitripennis]